MTIQQPVELNETAIEQMSKFERPIPGQSLTSEPGKLPYEKPPMYANTMEAFQSIKSSLYGSRESAEELAEIIDSGISCETLASSIVISSFMKGMFNPDVAELINCFF